MKRNERKRLTEILEYCWDSAAVSEDISMRKRIACDEMYLFNDGKVAAYRNVAALLASLVETGATLPQGKARP